MPVEVVQVVNNTVHKLMYKNSQSGRVFIVPAQSPHYANNDWIPSSDFRDDAVPFYSSGHYVEMRLGDFAPVRISDADWKFSIVGQSGRSGDVVRDCYGELVNGGKYVVRLDEVVGTPWNRCGITIYKYDDSIKSVSGHVMSQVLQHASVVVGPVLMTIFF